MTLTYDYKFARFIGNPNNKFGLQKGKVYEVTHTYGSNVGIRKGKTSYGETLVSLSPSNLQGVATQDLTLTDMFGNEKPSIQVVAVLTYNGDPIGVRFTSKNIPLFDIEFEKLHGLPLNLEGYYPYEPLLPYGELLMTEDEYTHRLKSLDLSENKGLCDYILRTTFMKIT